MKRLLLVFAFLAFASCGFCEYNGYVRVSPRIGYYLVEAGSPLQDQLGYTYAPILDTSDPLHRGAGRDVIAIRYDARGILAAPPAYIYQMIPETFYTQRLNGLVQHRSSVLDVEQLLYRGSRKVVPQSWGTLVYYEIPVTNPLDGPRGSFPGF